LVLVGFSYFLCWCFPAFSLLFLSVITTRITTVTIINTAIRAPTAPRMAASRVEGLVGLSVKGFVAEPVSVLEEEEGDEELLRSPVTPTEVTPTEFVVTITVGS